MRQWTFAVALCSAFAGPACGQVPDQIAQWIAEMESRYRAEGARHDYDTRLDWLMQELRARGVDPVPDRVRTWVGWDVGDWRCANAFYWANIARLEDWQKVVAKDEVALSDSVGILAPAIAEWRVIDRYLGAASDAVDGKYVEMGVWYTRYLHSDQGLDGPFRTTALHVFEMPPTPNWCLIGSLAVVPEAPRDGILPGTPAHYTAAAAAAAAALAGGKPGDLRGAVKLAHQMLAAAEAPDAATAADMFRLLDERLELGLIPVEGLIAAVAALPPGPERDAAASLAMAALEDHLTHLAPMLAAGAAAGTPEERASATSRLLDAAYRAKALVEDAENPIGPPSSLLRLVSALKAAAGTLDAAGSGDLKAKELVAVLNDIGTGLGKTVSPIAPFATPMATLAAQLDATRTAWDEATAAMNGIADAIGGDPAGLDRAKAAGGRLSAALAPDRMVAAMSDAAANGLAGLAPIFRSLFSAFG